MESEIVRTCLKLPIDEMVSLKNALQRIIEESEFYGCDVTDIRERCDVIKGHVLSILNIKSLKYDDHSRRATTARKIIAYLLYFEEYKPLAIANVMLVSDVYARKLIRDGQAFTDYPKLYALESSVIARVRKELNNTKRI